MNMKKHKNIGILLLYLFFLISITIINDSLARYHTSLTGSDKAKVGLFVIKDDIQTNIDVNLSKIDSESPITYTFYIQNYNEKGTSEVNTRYTLSFKTKYGNLPLEYSLYKDDGTDNVLNGENTYTDLLHYGVEEKIKYILIINLPKEAYDYQDMVDIMSIQIEAVQVD